MIGRFKPGLINVLGPWWETLQWGTRSNDARPHGAVGPRPAQDVEGVFHEQTNAIGNAARVLNRIFSR